MYDKVYVYGVTEDVLVRLTVIEKAEIPYGSKRVYFNPDAWREITATAEADGYTEDELRFFTKDFHEVRLIAPHNQPQIVCQFVSRSECRTMSLEEAEKIAEGHSEDLSEMRAAGRCVHRQELDNRPTFSGWAGPMWDGVRENGTAVIRYEAWDVYERMCN